jgi:CRP/FNR family transcriptional regulator, cyclic AMP receptor protein
MEVHSMLGGKSLIRQRHVEKGSVLKKHFLFGKLNSKQIDRLASCIVVKFITRGITIFAKGDPGSSLFAICKGAVRITAP